jgi:hypothetical protein
MLHPQGEMPRAEQLMGWGSGNRNKNGKTLLCGIHKGIILYFKENSILTIIFIQIRERLAMTHSFLKNKN